MNLKCIKVRDDIVNDILYIYRARIVEIDKLTEDIQNDKLTIKEFEAPFKG